MRKRTAVIQVRVSSHKQAEKELPVESQLQRCQGLAERLNATVLRVFVEDGVSGWHGVRRQFEEALSFCEHHVPDYFITWSTSRFARNQLMSVTARSRLERIGTEIVYASFDPGSDPETRFLNIGLRELMDEYFSRQVSKDTKRSRARNADSGYWNGGRSPYGYRPEPAQDNPKRKRLVIVPREADVVRTIYHRRLYGGLGARAIGMELNQQGHLNRDVRWTKQSVTSVLRSDAVRGCVVFGKRDRPHRRLLPREQWTIVKSHEAIIDEEQWARVQGLMTQATRSQESGSPRSGFLFTGLMRCDRCGAGMQIETATGGNGRHYSYYNCRNAARAPHSTPSGGEA